MRVTFIVGTGRCGSTMLSDVLRHHPDVLSLSEFFAGLSPLAFPAAALDGEQFWRILATPRLKPNTLVRQGARISEFLYPASGRFSPGEIPAISFVTLPHLSTEPDLLYDELARTVPRWPLDEPAAQYRRLFGWLLERLGRRIVVERSGGSLQFLQQRLALFPEATFLHLHRNGPDAAVSMSRHPSFRLAMVLGDIIQLTGADPFHVPSDEYADRLPPDLREFLPDRFRVAALWERDIRLATFGQLWSRQIVHGVAAFNKLPPSSRMTMAYEEILAEPARRLAELSRFVGARVDDEWLRRAVDAIDPGRPTGIRAAADSDLTELMRACGPGTRVLRRLSARAEASTA
jgi:putative sulfotransferase